jgi:hypothetical protein
VNVQPLPPGPLLVIAGSYAEFRAFRLDENLYPRRDNVVYIHSPEQLRGRTSIRWHLYGTGNRRTWELMHIAESRPGAVYVDIPSKRDERNRRMWEER